MSIRQQKKMNKRAIVSMSMLFSFIWLPPSGVVLHLTDNAAMSQLRHAAMAVHNFAGIIFLISALIHVVYNFNAIKQYTISRVKMVPTLKREAIIAFLITTFFILFLASHAFHVH